MTTPAPQDAHSALIRFPGVATALLSLSPFLLLFGWLTVMGTGSRGYFDRAPTQAMLGSGMILIGVMTLVAALTLVGVRAIAQQQIDILRQGQVGSGDERVVE